MNYEFKKTLPVYRYSYAKALSRKEEQAYEASFQENVRCAQDIKETIYRHFNLETKELKPGCAEYILQRYGPLRTSYVLANTFQTEGCPSCFGEKIAEWSRDVYGLDAFAPHDHRFLVNVASIPLSMFISQMSEAYHALGFFGLEHCIGDKYTTEYRGKVLLLKPNIRCGSCWTQHDQLWYAHGGHGCRPCERFKSIQASCLSSGKRTSWLRLDFAGVFNEQYLPDWAVERLEAIRAPK